MYRLFSVALLATAVLMVSFGVADSATDTETLIINATVAARAKLEISPTTINFADADPDLVDPIPATESPVSVNVKVRTTSGGAVTLICLANGDLQSGGDVIGIDNVTWTATGGGFVNGTLSNSAAQSVGSWTGSGNRSGTLDFFLGNSWDFNVGNYTQTVDYTLTAP
ncbi:hypothetical protein ACFL6M_02815 [Candidatus Eisenbacteria bacterium]|uniref:Spore coat protein U domain-containing protein n=1 Tax=Eiseniibacteriota bacterium TaxID=2212470 RepID=A0ABV6YJK0_UNCEI